MTAPLAGIVLAVLATHHPLPPKVPYPIPHPAVPQAPDMCGPGYYWTNPYGQVYGPGYYVYPSHLPFQGMLPAPCCNGNGNGYGNGNGMFGSPSFPTHPFARSPRDYFMVE